MIDSVKLKEVGILSINAKIWMCICDSVDYWTDLCEIGYRDRLYSGVELEFNLKIIIIIKLPQ